MEPGRDRQLLTLAVVLGMCMAALEATAVAAAMPSAAGEMGGMARYSWVFSAYLLTSTVTVPLYGKLADVYGRRRLYHVAMAVFLFGSILCGVAGTIGQLILFRAIQGLGAGGVMPVASTVIADVYSLEERGKVQSVFSGVWAVCSLVGPLLGGWITDEFSWRWIFWLNLPFGLISAWMFQRTLRSEPRPQDHRLDWLGTVSLTAAVTLLLVGAVEAPTVWGWTSPLSIATFAAGGASLALFLWQERRAPEPILPLNLFANRLISLGGLGNMVVGTLLFALTAFVPIFGQGVLGGTAMDAGTILAPMLLGWPITSTIAGWLLMRLGYRKLSVSGALLVLAGIAPLAWIGAATTRIEVMACLFVIGLGLGFASIPFYIGPQNAVAWNQRGVVTSALQFSRTIGGTIGVAALGALLNAHLIVGGRTLKTETALDPALRAAASPGEIAAIGTALLSGLHAVFAVLVAIAASLLFFAWWMPGGDPKRHVYQE